MRKFAMVVSALIFVSNLLNAAEAYDRSEYYGEAVNDSHGNLIMVQENASQVHSQDEYVLIKVKNINNSAGRIRVGMWNDKVTFDNKEEMRPYRASSFPASFASNALNGEMTFKIGGLTSGEEIAFFAHHDENDDGKLNRNLFGVPTEPYMFSCHANGNEGPGMKREGLSPPSFESTVITYTHPGQVITLSL
jgi:uncharacterized protein (DUF2141 family)